MAAWAPNVLQRLAIFDGQTATADFKIVHGDREWPVHRWLLTLHSKVLEKACFGDFKESSDGKLDLSKEPANIVEAFVHFLYHLDYNVSVPDTIQTRDQPLTTSSEQTQDSKPDYQEPVGALSFHTQMALLGDYYDMDHLRNTAAYKFHEAIGTRDYKTICDQRDITLAAQLAYQAPSAVAGICIDLVLHLLRNKAIFQVDTQDPSVGDRILSAVPALAVDYGRALRGHFAKVESILEQDTFKCPGCNAGTRMAIGNADESYECEHCDTRLSGSAWDEHLIYSGMDGPALQAGTLLWWHHE